MSERLNFSESDWLRAEAILAVVAEHGTFTSQAGSVLSDLALLSGVEYKTVSRIVLWLEANGFVTVERMYRREAERANIVLSITAT